MEEKQNAQILLQEIMAKSLALGITGKQLASLESMKLLSTKRTYRRKRSTFLVSVIALVIIAMTLQWASQREIYTLRGFMKLFFSLNDDDLEIEECAVSTPQVITDFLRPPQNCSICKNIPAIDRVSNITKESFLERYAYTQRPVVVTDGAQNWTALKVFGFEFFRSLYTNDSPTLDHLNSACQFFPYETEFESLREVFNMSESRANMTNGSEPWYIGWSNCDSSAFSELRSHYSRPYFLPSDSESSPADWIFMGSPGYGANYHIDYVKHPSWQAQISGKKTWTLYPPLECYMECSVLETTLEPGDIFVVDSNWWFHETLIVGDKMSITIGSEYD